jgi:hypothetical protein
VDVTGCLECGGFGVLRDCEGFEEGVIILLIQVLPHC